MNRILSTSKFLAMVAGLCLVFASAVFAQETTAGLQGTVKDSSGAVVSKAHVVVSGSSLVGDKSTDTDSGGYYRFANLPPGSYSVTVTAQGFSTYKTSGLVLEVGHLPTLDVPLQVGTTSTVVEVSGAAAPLVDVTTNTNQTNITEEIIANAPHGYSFQSMIQFAPMARNEPLAGGQMYGGGTGGSLPGSSGNGAAVGYSIGGAADSESSYLVDGIDTENISGGYSNANVPYEFIQEVQVKTSGVEAQYGGALGGVINVVSKSGGNAFHGSGFFTFEGDGTDGAYTTNNHDSIRYDPLGTAVNTPGTQVLDQPAQTYVPKADAFKILQPGFTFGGPIKKDRVWFYLGYAPYEHTIDRTVNFNPAICQPSCPDAATGVQTFHLKNWQYFTNARVDAAVTQKVRVFGEWLYQYTRETGDSLPSADPIASESSTFLNSGVIGSPFGILTPISQFDPKHGWSQPNSLYVTGADITLTPAIVSTTRFGYFFTNYHDFGWPTTGANLVWNESGVGANGNNGTALPAGLQLNGGTTTTPYDSSYTLFNASKHYQFNQDVAIFKSGWLGTHNFRLGYQLNRMSNVIDQNGNVPEAFLSLGSGQSYGASSVSGNNNCALLKAEWPTGNCAGQYGYVTIQDFATILAKPAVDWNHAFYVQDAWNVGRGLTLNVGVRIEKESLPVPPGLQQPGVAPPKSIDFSWSDKVAPRVGAAWGSPNGKTKIFGSYGVVNDVMKLLLAQTSWGGQAFEDCVYPLGPDSGNSFVNSDVALTYVNSRACPNGGATQGANFAGGTTPASLTDSGTGVQLIENTNFRPWEPVAPGVKPYRQHEFVIGYDYQVAKDWAFEARYDRRRLDHVIEDASLADPFHFEMYTIVNPGEGVNSTIDRYSAFLGSLGSAYGVPNFFFSSGAFGTCPSCPPNPKAVRDYDGAELRLTKAPTHGWGGLFSYTWSRLWGNYTGLTTTDQTDGGGTGRNSPDTTRAFDEPFYYFGANGKSNNGLLPTDRPNAFKGDVYYTMPWKHMATTLGLFQAAYSGTPISSFTDIGLACCNEPIEAVDIFGRGKFASVTQDPVTGALTLGSPSARRTPWYTQTDLQVSHAVKFKESLQLKFSATALNLLNQRAIVNYYQGFNSIAAVSAALPGSIFGGAPSYQVVEGGYNPTAAINGVGFVKSSQYGLPNQWQLSRSLRLGVEFTF